MPWHDAQWHDLTRNERDEQQGGSLSQNAEMGKFVLGGEKRRSKIAQAGISQGDAYSDMWGNQV